MTYQGCLFPLLEVDEDDEEPVLFESEKILFSKNPDGHYVFASLDDSIALRFAPLVVVEDGSDVCRFVKQDPILLLGGSNLYSFTSNTNTWWNLTPVKHPHTGTIHGTGSALRTHLPYSTPTGIINYIVPR